MKTDSTLEVSVETPGSIIARIALQCGITPHRLGQIAGISGDTVAKILKSGGNGMRLNILRQICAALNISPNTVIELLPPVVLEPPPPLLTPGRKRAGK